MIPMETLTPPTADPVEAPPEPTSLWEDLVEIFVAPRDVFARRRDGRYGAALVVLTVVTVFLAYGMLQALGPAFDAEFDRAMRRAAENGGRALPAEQMAQARTIQGYGMVGGSLVIVPILAFATGGGILLLARILGAAVGFAVSMVIATYSLYPGILRSLAMILQGLLMDAQDGITRTAIGPARFLDPDTTSPALLAVLGRVELFALWGAVLIAIGLQAAGRVPAGKAWVAAAVVWLVGMVPQLLGALAR